VAAALAAALGLALLAGCVFVPQTVAEYDPECQLRVKRMELKAMPRGFMRAGGCSGEACAAVLVTAGVVTVGSMVISGSIVVVGNAAYWIEEQARCLRGQTGEADDEEDTAF
jgi:hypothetical protein